MRIVILDESGRPEGAERPGAALASRFEAAGLETRVFSLDAPGAEHEAQAALAGADAALEAVVADPAQRRHADDWIEAALPEGRPALLCCHASDLSTRVAGRGDAGRRAGWALTPPCADRETVEVCRGLATDDRAAEAADALWRAVGLTPVAVGDGAGLALPRTLACLANEAAFAVMEGAASARDVDRAMTLGTRYPRGPLAWSEILGLDAVLATLDALAREHGEDRYRAAPLLRRMAAAGARWELT